MNFDTGVTGLDLSRAFYDSFGKNMIKEKFPNYESQIAVGLVGQGSECFGFDDIHSQDHDFGAGFCMWLPDSLFAEIGQDLERAYQALPREFQGFTREVVAPMKRLGVFSISEFYASLIEFPFCPPDDLSWMCLEDFQLAEATNGLVFRDDLGAFSKIREELLAHYPDEVLGKKLAEKIHLVSQKGQYNYPRMLKRGENLVSRVVLSEFLLNTMELICLLNKVYAPYYKWTYARVKTLPILADVVPLLEEIETFSLGDEKIFVCIEEIVSKLIQELKRQGMVQTVLTGNFLHDYIAEVASFGTSL